MSLLNVGDPRIGHYSSMKSPAVIEYCTFMLHIRQTRLSTRLTPHEKFTQRWGISVQRSPRLASKASRNSPCSGHIPLPFLSGSHQGMHQIELNLKRQIFFSLVTMSERTFNGGIECGHENRGSTLRNVLQLLQHIIIDIGHYMIENR